jgi:hypothetical protein
MPGGIQDLELFRSDDAFLHRPIERRGLRASAYRRPRRPWTQATGPRGPGT